MVCEQRHAIAKVDNGAASSRLNVQPLLGIPWQQLKARQAGEQEGQCAEVGVRCVWGPTLVHGLRVILEQPNDVGGRPVRAMVSLKRLVFGQPERAREIGQHREGGAVHLGRKRAQEADVLVDDWGPNEGGSIFFQIHDAVLRNLGDAKPISSSRQHLAGGRSACRAPTV